jgi:serine/threonine protein kinase
MHKNAKYLQPVDMEIKALQVLEEKVIRCGVSSCILEMIYHSCCENVIRLSKALQKKKKKSSKHDIDIRHHGANKTLAITNTLINYSKVVDLGLAHDKISFIALEKYTLTLRTFLSKPIYLQMDAEIIRVILFQIIYTFYQIQQILPGFKHNDLHTDNIMIKIDPDFVYDPKNPVFELYRTNIGDFLVPYLGFHAKIIDFAFAQIPSMKVYSYSTLDKEIMAMRMCNDIYFLLHDFRRTNEYGAQVVQSIEPDMEDSLLDVEYDTNMISSYRRYLKSNAFNTYRYKDGEEVNIIKTFKL